MDSDRIGPGFLLKSRTVCLPDLDWSHWTDAFVKLAACWRVGSGSSVSTVSGETVAETVSGISQPANGSSSSIAGLEPRPQVSRFRVSDPPTAASKVVAGPLFPLRDFFLVFIDRTDK